MTAFAVVLATPDPNKAEGVQTYVEAVQPLLRAAGAKPVVRGPVVRALAGSSPPASVTIFEFPDATTATGFFAQDAYQALVALRDASFARMEIHIPG